MSINQTKRFIKRHFPAWLVDPIRRAKGSQRTPSPLLGQLEREHYQLNAGLPEDQFVFRRGLQIAIDPRARNAFEHFCFRRLGMVFEFDFFLREMGTKKAFLDVGANFGVFALAFTHGRPEALALAVDPSPTALEVLRENVRRNPGLRIEVAPLALGDKAGTILMRPNGYHLEAVADGKNAEQDVSTRVTTLTTLLKETNFEPDLVKIDVEGYELFVLRGAKEFLEKNLVDLFLEIHPRHIDDLGYTLRELTTELVTLGYEFFEPGQTLKPVSPAWVNDQIHTFWIICKAGNRG